MAHPKMEKNDLLRSSLKLIRNSISNGFQRTIRTNPTDYCSNDTKWDRMIKRKYHQLDLNNDGKVTTLELFEYLTYEGHDPDTIQMFVTAVDADGDGKVDFNEFKNFVNTYIMDGKFRPSRRNAETHYPNLTITRSQPVRAVSAASLSMQSDISEDFCIQVTQLDSYFKNQGWNCKRKLLKRFLLAKHIPKNGILRSDEFVYFFKHAFMETGCIY
ncbi:hypothetical protein Ciccas_010698 [Cichlidogyrus casuarinus]|uniref:EF-hand domain-containing protein n=1 Tax=Cichlidogyrus casuarinus TaxID=1844966 RepID=A0ABD2PTI5_9PLAT